MEMRKKLMENSHHNILDLLFLSLLPTFAKSVSY